MSLFRRKSLCLRRIVCPYSEESPVVLRRIVCLYLEESPVVLRRIVCLYLEESPVVWRFERLSGASTASEDEKGRKPIQCTLLFIPWF